jgi:hypothetical protein
MLGIKETQLSAFATLLQGLAAVLWPIFAFVVLFTVRPYLADLVRRLKKGKVFGQEIELQESRVLLDKSATSVASDVAALPVPAPTTKSGEEREAQEAIVSKIIAEAGRSPRAALLLLANELERLARDMIATSGHLGGRSFVPIHDAIAELDRMYGLPRHVPQSLKFFWEARSKLVHARDVGDDDILRAVDSGLTILKALQAMPREINIVYDPSATVYHDESLTKPIEGIRGVVFETIAPSGSTKTYLVFPTTRDHFIKGKQVAWEWNMNSVVGPAWFRDPDTGQAKSAWSSAAEFVGRNLDDL